MLNNDEEQAVVKMTLFWQGKVAVQTQMSIKKQYCK
jgi:hypothetical protein